ncbi:hypothetical protein OAB94_01635 [Flavobacteriaceae bacterium]|nr:hypothetical protein [Flavobacteriaceae bacterium]
MATPQDLINQINAAIITNGNNEITAIVLNPILVDMVTQYDDLIGDLSQLLTTDQSSLVNAINEIFGANIGLTNVIQGAGILIDYTDAKNPIISLGTQTTNAILNSSTAPGVNLTDALDFLYDNSLGNINALGDIGNVDILAAQTGQTIVWNQATLRWENKFVELDFIQLQDTPINYNSSKGKNLKVGTNEIVFTPDYFDFALSDETSDLITGVCFTMVANRDYNNISRCDFSVTDAPTGSNIQIDVLKNGVSVFSTLPRIANGEFRTATATIQQVIIGGNFEILAGSILVVTLTQVGSGNAGAGLKGTLIFNNPVI